MIAMNCGNLLILASALLCFACLAPKDNLAITKITIENTSRETNYAMSSSRQLFAGSPRKKAKKSEKAERIARQNMLMSLANDHADECNGMLRPKISSLMKEFREWLDVSELGFFGPMLSLTSFFMHRGRTEVEDKKISQPIKVWVELVAFPGCKKTAMHKLFNENLDRFKTSHQRNLTPCNLHDVVHAGGTTQHGKHLSH